MLYLIGSLRNPEIPRIAQKIREETKEEVFDDWFAAGPEADDKWRDYEKTREHSYIEALGGYAAKHVFDFDLHHLDRCRAAILVLPAGKSGHLELGYIIGKGRPGYILLDDPERWDVMYQFASGVFASLEKLIQALKPPCYADSAQIDPEILKTLKKGQWQAILPVKGVNSVGLVQRPLEPITHKSPDYDTCECTQCIVRRAQKPGKLKWK